VNNHADLNRLLRCTTEAFQTVLRAVLDADRHAAREVLHGSAHRRALVEQTMHARAGHPWAPPPQVASELQFVSDIGEVGRLVDDLARQTAAAEDRELRLTPGQQMEVAVLLDAGSRRLRRLTDGLLGPGLSADDRGCGSALFEVADHEALDRAEVVVLCAALATTLLQATRHAARAA
jgi:hypothetical protein